MIFYHGYVKERSVKILQHGTNEYNSKFWLEQTSTGFRIAIEYFDKDDNIRYCTSETIHAENTEEGSMRAIEKLYEKYTNLFSLEIGNILKHNV